MIITIAEIEAGNTRAIRMKAKTKAEMLRSWLATLEYFYAGRILPFGVEEARYAGQMLDCTRAHGPGFEDVDIAATVAVHGLSILTTN